MNDNWTSYELLDFGNGKKLERFEDFILIRPESMARQVPKYAFTKWEKMASAEFVDDPAAGKAGWRYLKSLPESWEIRLPFDSLRAELKPGKFKHIGIFPEQFSHWQYLYSHLKPGARVLNLFAYTGISSLVARAAGAEVIHVEALRSLISQARQNMEISGLDGIRWVHDDALKFVQRQAKRKTIFDLIIADPPAYGRGPKGEIWTLDQQFENLAGLLKTILAPHGLLIMNTYSPKLPFEQKQRSLRKAGFAEGSVKTGWLSLQTSDARTLNMSRYAICKGW